MNICLLRKRFLKEVSSKFIPQESNTFKHKNNLAEENEKLKFENNQLVDDNESGRHVINALEEKIDKAEAEVYSQLKDLKNTKETLQNATDNTSELKCGK